jgi:hypothetical protein
MINKSELIEIRGGTSSTIINTIVKVVTTAIEIGRTVGTIIRRKISGNKC